MTDWRATLKQNWLYMLTAILVSLFLWVGVSADRVAQKDIAADLVIRNNDPRYLISGHDPQTDVVTVRFTGRAGDLGILEASRPQLVVVIDSVQSLTTDVTLTPDMVRTRGGRDLDVSPVNVRPDRIRIVFEARTQKVVRVVPRTQIDPAPGFVQADSARTQPGAIAISGPEDALQGIDSVMTAPLRREGAKESIDAEVPLERPLTGTDIELSSSSVRVTVPIDPWTERTFSDIGVAVRGSGDFATEPPAVTVTVAGPERVVQAVETEQLQPYVEVGADSTGQERLFPVLLTPPDRRLQVDLRPDSVRVVRSR